MESTVIVERSAMRLSLRPACAEDEPFLYTLYTSTREDELAAWGWDAAQADSFLRMQFSARQRHFQAQVPAPQDAIVLRDGRPVGRLAITHLSDCLYLVDIALLTAERGAGLGSALLRDLQAAAAQAGLPVRLHVLLGSPARRLYERLGFHETGQEGLYLAMEWQPGEQSPADLDLPGSTPFIGGLC